MDDYRFGNSLTAYFYYAIWDQKIQKWHKTVIIHTYVWFTVHKSFSYNNYIIIIHLREEFPILIAIKTFHCIIFASLTLTAIFWHFNWHPIQLSTLFIPWPIYFFNGCIFLWFLLQIIRHIVILFMVRINPYFTHNGHNYILCILLHFFVILFDALSFFFVQIYFPLSQQAHDLM